jgi:5-methylcytosine-specific restriction enzyme A
VRHLSFQGPSLYPDTRPPAFVGCKMGSRCGYCFQCKMAAYRLTGMSTTRVMTGGWVNRSEVPKGPHGRGMCRWCSLEVPPGRFTFCSEYCVHEWKLRTQPGYLREQVLLRDRGICASCGVDTIAAARRLRYSCGAKRLALMRYWGMGTRPRKSLWDADHIIPVAEGGGECDLENIRTLCLRCHRIVTAELRERIRSSPEE